MHFVALFHAITKNGDGSFQASKKDTKEPSNALFFCVFKERKSYGFGMT